MTGQLEKNEALVDDLEELFKEVEESLDQLTKNTEQTIEDSMAEVREIFSEMIEERKKENRKLVCCAILVGIVMSLIYLFI